MNSIYLRNFTAFLCVLAIFGCDSQNPPQTTTYAPITSAVIIAPLAHNTVWDKMAAEFSFKNHQFNPRVQRFIKQYTRENSYQLIRISEQAKPYLYHVTKLLEERNMPLELALLPIIESEYRPTATSNMGAVGIWQLAALTGRLYGLKQDQWYDGRKDVDSATKVAINHLQYLYERFDHDWLLALAAYNAGDARVAAAIRANKKQGKPTDYWSLNLPQETQYFVPKFLSLVYLIKNHRNLDIDLATIPNKPYFDTVKLEKQINLQQVAKLAGMDIKDVKRLNAACRAQVTHPKGPHHITLPVSQIAIFKANLKALANTVPSKPKAMPQIQKVQNTFHTVNKGDTLHIIASRYRTTVQSIKNKNNLTSDIIRHGQKLAI
jgi:membrane-bound lytic murein transglycosylase D